MTDNSPNEFKMNEQDLNPNYKKFYKIVHDLFSKTKHFQHGPYDETYFTLRVYESAKEIIAKLKHTNPSIKINEQMVLVAAIFHDIGKTKLDSSLIDKRGDLTETEFHKEWEKHPALSVPIAKEILEKENHSSEFSKAVCYLIENHANRSKKLDKSTELKILQDADLIADCGFAGFIRPFLFSGKYVRSVIGAIRYLKQSENRVEKKDWLNLGVSLDIARAKMHVQRELVNEIHKDLESELLD
jgi:HD superfamily phosphodiesterase